MKGSGRVIIELISLNLSEILR